MKAKKRKSLWTNILLIHRYVGILVALFVIELAITGILLNHTEDLQLDEKEVKVPWLMEAYGIKADPVGDVFKVVDKVLYQRGSQVYLEKTALTCASSLIGTISHQELIIVGSKKHVCLILEDGSMIDEIPIEPQAEIHRIGLLSNYLVVLDTSIGQFKLNEEMTMLIPQEVSEKVVWSEKTLLDRADLEEVETDTSDASLSLERIILDLHSGRIAGIGGVYVMDVVAFMMIVLSMTGLSIWMKRLVGRRKRSQK